MSDFGSVPPPVNVLKEVEEYGANPGDLRMWTFVPPGLPPNSPLVVVLHGCTQSAAAFDYGSGWSQLAQRHGFAVLYPEQQRANNPNLCFNWFDPQDTARGRGEVLSIHRMIATMVRVHQVSARRIFITGLSAGGAMASAMLAAYPEVFAAGAIIAGLPFGVATNLREALQAMAKPPTYSPRKLGDLVRAASSHSGPWPRVSVWHGDADRVVNPTNAEAVAAQWCNVHGLPGRPMAENVTDGQRHQVWWDADGASVVESFSVNGMAHGVPLDLSDGSEAIGAQGAFMLEAGIASTLHIAHFFGLVGRPAARIKKPFARPKPDFASAVGRQPQSVGSIINRALTAAGLLK